MGDETATDFQRYRRAVTGIAPRAPDLDKARAERRANVREDIGYGLVADPPAARNTDPETSHVAAHEHRTSGRKASNQRRILEFVRQVPGCTSIEISIATGIERHETSRRLADLKGDPERGTAPLVCQGAPRESGGRKPCVTWWPL